MSSQHPHLSDVAVEPPDTRGLALSEVGLENVQMMILREGARLPARGRAVVSLDDVHARGIHMSRLFRVLTQMSEREFNWSWLEQSLDQMLESHRGLSNTGDLAVSFELPVLRSALLSDQKGWRTYPVTWRVHAENGNKQFSLSTSVLYSSTCPCSSALSLQDLQAAFAAQFSDGMVPADAVHAWLAQPRGGFPHAQRSEARVELVFAASQLPESPLPYIDLIENALGTPVQAAVKRVDEQEFARLNARHQMFCEDAARKLKAALRERQALEDFRIEVRHFESLHAHDVVARVNKND